MCLLILCRDYRMNFQCTVAERKPNYGDSLKGIFRTKPCELDVIAVFKDVPSGVP